MKLYYSPGACSLAPHIILEEAGVAFETECVDLASHTTESGKDFREVNPKGYVPALCLDDGQVLSEASVIVQYLADRCPQAGLVPEAGTMDRYKVQEWLNFVSAEVHKTLGALFNPAITAEWRANQLDVFARRADLLEQHLQTSDYLHGNRFGVADAYLFTVLGWTGIHGVDLAPWPSIRSYIDRIASRPAVRAAMVAEGLLPDQSEILAKAS